MILELLGLLAGTISFGAARKGQLKNGILSTSGSILPVKLSSRKMHRIRNVKVLVLLYHTSDVFHIYD